MCQLSDDVCNKTSHGNIDLCHSVLELFLASLEHKGCLAMHSDGSKIWPFLTPVLMWPQ